MPILKLQHGFAYQSLHLRKAKRPKPVAWLVARKFSCVEVFVLYPYITPRQTAGQTQLYQQLLLVGKRNNVGDSRSRSMGKPGLPQTHLTGPRT